MSDEEVASSDSFMVGDVPVVLPNEVPAAIARTALEWLEATFGGEWLSARLAELDANGPTGTNSPHPVAHFVRALRTAASEPSGTASPVDGRTIIPIIQFVDRLNYVSPGPEWIDEMQKGVRSNRAAFEKRLAELTVASSFKFVGHEVELKAAGSDGRSCDISLLRGGERVAEVEVKAQDPASESDRNNFKILGEIAPSFWPLCATVKSPGVRLVVSATRDLVATDVEEVSKGLRDVNLGESSNDSLGESGIALEILPVIPFALELVVDTELPFGDSPRLQQDSVWALAKQFVRPGTFQTAVKGKFKCCKVEAQRAIVEVSDISVVELRLGKYPDRVNAVRRHMEKAATQVTGDVPAVMYLQWRAMAPPLSDDLERACELAKEHIERHPPLSAVVVYRPQGTGVRRFEFIANPRARHAFPKGFRFGMP